MAFDFSTLVTDRTMADVLARNAKGTYNAADLNRVDECLEDLVARLGRMGYSVPGYQRVKLSRETKPSSRLPEGYTEVQYIQSSGTQFLDTGVRPTVNTMFSFGIYMLENTGDCIVGNFLNDDNDYRIFNYQGTIYWDFKSGRLIGATGSFPMNEYLEFECGNYYVNKNGQRVLTGENITSFTADTNIFAFSNGNSSAGCSGKLYFLKIYEGGTLIRDFIPCTNADGAAGLYDLMGQEFYGNAGTGSFTAGEAVTWPEDPEEPAEELDPYTWYESDVPTVSQVAQYRGNVAAVRAVLQLPIGTPESPGAMAQLTTAVANNIEAVLLAVDLILNNIPAAVRHCGVTVCGSKGVIA